MISDNGRIWLFIEDLTDLGISKSYITTACDRSRKLNKPTWISKKHPADNRVILIDYDTIPSATKSKLPSKTELIEQEQAAKSLIKADRSSETLLDMHAANKTKNDYLFLLSKVFDKSKANDLANAAAWLRFLNQYRTKKDTVKLGFNRKSDLQKEVVALLISQAEARKRHLYGFKVSNHRVIDNKERLWRSAFQTALEEHSNLSKIMAEKRATEAALDTLVPDHIGNTNAQIIGKPTGNNDILIAPDISLTEWHASQLFELYCNFGKANKLDFEEVHRRYERRCIKASKTPVSVRSVKRWLSIDVVDLYATRERNGYASFDKYMPHTYGKRPECSLSKGGYDGFSVDFYTKGEFTNRKGELVKGKLMLTVVAVYDYMSEAITGYDINLVEDGLMVRNMYRNHLNMMGGRSYIEIESDRFSGNLTDDTVSIFEEFCEHITQPVPNDPQGKASNPKARFVERLVQESNRLAQSAEGWKGTNITSIDSQRKPNPDYKSKNYITSYEEGVNQIIKLINVYNNVKLKKYGNKSRIEVCKANINPDAPTIPAWSMALTLNQNTVTTVRNGKIGITVNGRDFEYPFPGFEDYVHRMYKGMKVMVCYDETDMTNVDIFGENDDHIATLGKLNRFQKAKAEATAEDHAEAGRQRANRKHTEEKITLKNLEFEASLYDIDISNLPFKEALATVMAARALHADERWEDIDERFADELATEDAVAATAYYQDRLLTDRGLSVPVVHDEDLERERREFERNKFKREYPNE